MDNSYDTTNSYDNGDMIVSLSGVQQYKRQVEAGTLAIHNYNNKVKALLDILASCNFQQCLVFSNLMTRYQRT